MPTITIVPTTFVFYAWNDNALSKNIFVFNIIYYSNHLNRHINIPEHQGYYNIHTAVIFIPWKSRKVEK